MARITLRFRLDLPNGFSIGPGKIALLHAIDAAGSLSEAARHLGLSYRRAWLLVRDLNDTFIQPVTTASVGGRDGGGAKVTEFGKTLIQTYEAAEAHYVKYAEAHLQGLSGVLSGAAPARSRSRMRPGPRARRLAR
jgi:molybdate transport system regulatory protein